MLIQDRCRRHVSRQGAVSRQGVEKGFKTSGCRKTGGTRQGGCGPTVPLSCAKTGAIVKRTTQPLEYSGYFHLLERKETPRTCTGAGYGVPKMDCDRGGGGAVGFILTNYT